MAAIIAANLAHAEKGKEKEKERAREKVVNAVFEKYDTNRSGIMEVEELTNVLTMMNGGGDPPTKDEVAWVMSTAMRSVPSKTGQKDGLTKEQLKIALEAYSSYADSKPVIHAYFAKYDKSKDNALQLDELKQLLSDLNHGVPPTAKQLQFVMHTADGKDGVIDNVIKPTELLYAISLWRSLIAKVSKQN